MNLKKLFFIIFCIPITITAQVPQGIGYQGVATNGSGLELINQNISIKASIISDSTTGTVQWQETHNTTTDQFGLFNVVIGQGSSTGVGQTTNFDNMNWGSGNHYLRIEMDATGGSNYTLFGTSQLMSVPYALYAKNAGIDSTILANMIGSSLGGIDRGCDLKFPDGIGQMITWELFQNDYTVPAGKNLYITNLYAESAYYFEIDGKNLFGYDNYAGDDGNMLHLPICVNEGQTISYFHHSSWSSPSILPTFHGTLVNATVEPITYNFDNSGTGFESYVVPAGKKLIITQLWIYQSDDYLSIDGKIFAEDQFNTNTASGGKQIKIPLIINSGSTLFLDDNSAGFNGYLADENFFADCGGGGGSSISTVDSSYIDSLVQFYLSESGGGCNFLFPEGFDGEAITVNATQNNQYVVPSGKRLYVTSSHNMRFNTNDPILGMQYVNSHSGKPLIFNSGESVHADNNAFNGYIVDEDYFENCGVGGSSSSSNILPALLSNQTILMATIPSFLSGDFLDTIIPNQSSYTVPSGKQLFVRFANTFPNPEPIIVDGQHISCSPTAGAQNTDWKKLIMDENETLSFGIYGSLNLHATLVDKNINEDWITIVLDDVNNLSYTVPTGKNIFINSVVVSCAYQGNYSGNLEGLQIGNVLYQSSSPLSVLNDVTEFEKLTFQENTTITLLTNSNPSMVIIRALLY